ncbi:MAG: gamma-glutamyl-gamma-aminobutyrate hydrolase family protein [Kurthia sp.]|nr:gamma-glutamyl-gamma-aminobutyrate hydrolase family protein [Candidatus Kurthia equi]
MRKPIIGITASYVKQNELSKGIFVHQDYDRAIIRAGGIPIVLPVANNELIDDYLTICDGIIFSGGEDIVPKFYGQLANEKLGTTYEARDEAEIYMLQAAMKKNKVILGICRGIQLINVALGGTLIQDIPSELETKVKHMQGNPRAKTSHDIRIDQTSLLFATLGEEQLAVNSLHHQSINQLGDGLKVTAYSVEDNIIEAIEHETYKKLLAVQWHPESLAYTHENMQRLFDQFVETSARSK